MKNEHGYTSVELMFIIASAFAILGWCVNLVTFVNSLIGATLGEVAVFTILQGIGIVVAPLGVVTGYFSLFV